MYKFFPFREIRSGTNGGSLTTWCSRTLLKTRIKSKLKFDQWPAKRATAIKETLESKKLVVLVMFTLKSIGEKDIFENIGFLIRLNGSKIRTLPLPKTKK